MMEPQNLGISSEPGPVVAHATSDAMTRNDWDLVSGEPAELRLFSHDKTIIIIGQKRFHTEKTQARSIADSAPLRIGRPRLPSSTLTTPRFFHHEQPIPRIQLSTILANYENSLPQMQTNSSFVKPNSLTASKLKTKLQTQATKRDSPRDFFRKINHSQPALPFSSLQLPSAEKPILLPITAPNNP